MADNTESDSSDTLFDDEILLVVAVASLIATEQQRQSTSIPFNRQTSGAAYTIDILTCGSDERIHRELRMTLNTFHLLRDWLLANTVLKSSRHMSIEEKLMVFLYITSKNNSNRDAAERFNHSGDTISR